MNRAISVFFSSIGILKKDKYCLILSMVPLLIAILIYSLLGTYLYGTGLDQVRGLIEDNVSREFWGSFLYYLLVAFMSVAAFFIVNFTFVLVVSVVASPFNDLLSERVEKITQGKRPEKFSTSLAGKFKEIFKIVFNELKKIIFIIVLSLLAFMLNLIPILAPVSLILTAWLMATSFLDYSWSRHTYSVRDCIEDIKKDFLPNTFGGLGFIALMSIPVVNIIALPLGVIYFTILFTKRNKLLEHNQ